MENRQIIAFPLQYFVRLMWPFSRRELLFIIVVAREHNKKKKKKRSLWFRATERRLQRSPLLQALEVALCSGKLIGAIFSKWIRTVGVQQQ